MDAPSDNGNIVSMGGFNQVENLPSTIFGTLLRQISRHFYPEIVVDPRSR